MGHVASALLGVLTFALVVLAIGSTYGYVTPAALGGLTTGNLTLFAIVALIAALGVYVVEGASRSSRKISSGRKGRG
jgi:hypothetical protein